LHAVRVAANDDLDAWAGWAGRESGARAAAPYVAGWCSWYHYFHAVTEHAVRDNLARAADLPIDVFQLDDGYQAAIGDWLARAPTFRSPLEQLAGDIAAAGYRPGIWIAPFLASPRSQLVAVHGDWLVRRPSGRPMIGMVNAGWGGEQYVLDTTHPDVLEHLEALAASLVDMGWTYLKLDFTYAPTFTGSWRDPTHTPAERVRAGYDAIRRGAGDDAFILGCGAPLGACIGVVDGMRIGPDVAPHWEPRDGRSVYAATEPSTANALRNTRARSFMHRRLWLNDPDCVMLRTTATDLTPAQIETWAQTVADTGGMALVSDDLSLLDDAARRRFADVVQIGRTADADRMRSVAE
jgi:alpha-galactosidase